MKSFSLNTRLWLPWGCSEIMVNDKVINKAILNELANYIQLFKMLPVKIFLIWTKQKLLVRRKIIVFPDSALRNRYVGKYNQWKQFFY